MASDPWSSAFKRAVEVDQEGEKDFADMKKSSGKRKLDNSTTPTGDDSKNSDDEQDESGGFCQPLKLSKFVNKVARKDGQEKEGTQTGDAVNETNKGPAQNNETDEPHSEPYVEERDMTVVCGRQLCRSWLKYTYLKLGGPCPDTCLRKHEITCKPELLYKDYAFKGLSAKQRKDIMQQLKSS